MPRLSLVILSVVFVLWPYCHVQCGILPELPTLGLQHVVPSVFQPNWWIGKINRRLDKILPGQGEDNAARPVVIIPEKQYVPIEDCLFSLGPMLQTLLDPGDQFAKVNYLMSPVGAAVLLSQLLIGTNLKFNTFLVDILRLSGGVRRRQIHVIELTPDPLYDDKLYNSEFHWKLNILLRSLNPNSEIGNYKFHQKSAFFYNEKANLVEYFKSYVARFYQTEMHPVNFFSPTSEKSINEWTDKQSDGVITDLPNVKVYPQTDSILLHVLRYEAEFETPFDENLTTTDVFNVEPYRSVDTTFFEGTFHKVLYTISPSFSLVGIPYKNFEAILYILLPNGPDFLKYDVRSFSESMDFNEIMEIVRTNGYYHNVKVKLPKIEMVTRFDLVKPIINYVNLQLMGDFNQNYQPISHIYLNRAAKNLKVSNIVQETYFLLTEYGTIIETNSTIHLSPHEAKNQSDHRMRPGNVLNFEVNRPFVFFIRHQATNATLYWGSITDPSLLGK